ncbi:MAG: SCO6745 family protein [Acidimicrobiales bacterium]
MAPGAAGWPRTMLGTHASPDQIIRATELLRRAAMAADLAGRPLYAGLRSLGLPGDGSWGDLWRASDLIREHRGDSHTLAWAAMGLTAVEITLLTERWWGIPLGTYVRTRGWTDDQIATAKTSLERRDFISGDDFTPAGEELRGVIEEMTDRGEAAIVNALGSDADELFAIIEPWGEVVVAEGGYPSHPRDMTRR